ncbi:MAG: ABC transporter permease [Saprospiraceae bacterium]
MFNHNIKLAFRNFKKDKSTFLINLIGLSTGLACAIMIFMWVNDEINVDKFHKNDAHLYQVLSHHFGNEKIVTWKSTPALFGDAAKEEMPEVKDAASSSRAFDAYGLTSNNVYLSAKGRFVTDNFFQLFSYEMLEGNQEKLFPNKNGIVISEELANKFYKDSKTAIGKTVTYEAHTGNVEAIIAGVFKNIPNNSSMQFDYLLSYDLYLENQGDRTHWFNFNGETYVLLKEGADIKKVNDKLKGFLKGKRPTSNVDLTSQKYSKNYLNGTFENGVQSGGRITYVRLFSIIAFFILLIACINFMNLSTAKATRKFKEIGVKKTIGANRQTLIFQYLGESLILSFLSLSFSVLIILLVLPNFNEITGKQLSLSLDPTIISTIFGITFLTGIISGSYPAFYLSGFSPAKVFKGNIKNSLGELWARKGLVVFQFSISIILIVSVLVVYKQIEFIQNKKLGFNKENVVHFKFSKTETVSQDAFISEIKNIPGVVDASSMWGSFVDQTASTDGDFDWEGIDPERVYTFNHFNINYDLLEMLGVETVAGRTFSKDYNNEYTKVIFNETGIKTMGLEDPIGKRFNLWGSDFEIIGVVKDFHYESLYKDIAPFFFRLLEPNDGEKIMVKIRAGEEQNTLAELENFHKKAAPNIPFEYHFLDMDYQELYESEKRVSTLSKYFAGFAIIISCLGLFGLAAFTAQRRIKEISIRKVLGANSFSIIRLLTLDFTKMVLIAIFIGIPISYFIAKKWLDDFAFSIDLSVWFFVMAGLLTLAIAWLTVSLQTMKAARVNPVNNLKE